MVPAAVGGGGFIGCDVLDQDGVDRIAGLDALVPTLARPRWLRRRGRLGGRRTARSTGTNVWGDGNILLGGGGSDPIEGRGADDIIDGDQYVNVRLSVRDDANGNATGDRSAPPTS